MEKISILLPTRERPEQLMRLYNSAMEKADKPELVEMIVYIDDDDNSYNYLLDSPSRNTILIRGPRKTISQCWNDCWREALGTIYWHAGDDVIIRTQGWDTIVRNAFNEYPDRILFAYGDDGNIESQNNKFGTHGFIHKNWTDVVGYFVPPYYESDYNDTHLNELAEAVHRHKHIDILTEHMHYSLGKSPLDKNTEDRLKRHERQRPEELYNSRPMRIERAEQIEKLRQFIEDYGN